MSLPLETEFRIMSFDKEAELKKSEDHSHAAYVVHLTKHLETSIAPKGLLSNEEFDFETSEARLLKELDISGIDPVTFQAPARLLSFRLSEHKKGLLYVVPVNGKKEGEFRDKIKHAGNLTLLGNENLDLKGAVGISFTGDKDAILCVVHSGSASCEDGLGLQRQKNPRPTGKVEIANGTTSDVNGNIQNGKRKTVVALQDTRDGVLKPTSTKPFEPPIDTSAGQVNVKRDPGSASWLPLVVPPYVEDTRVHRSTLDEEDHIVWNRSTSMTAGYGWIMAHLAPGECKTWHAARHYERQLELERIARDVEEIKKVIAMKEKRKSPSTDSCPGPASKKVKSNKMSAKAL